MDGILADINGIFIPPLYSTSGSNSNMSLNGPTLEVQVDCPRNAQLMAMAANLMMLMDCCRLFGPEVQR